MSSRDNDLTGAGAVSDDGDEVGEVDEDDDEYVEAEPVLAYTRMKNDMGITQIMHEDAVSCIKADHKIIVIGTHCGKIHIMDHNGNKIMTRDYVCAFATTTTTTTTTTTKRAQYESFVCFVVVVVN